jgi:pSer/pThr/pTyr-binding forkhead associated (FHA) protein
MQKDQQEKLDPNQPALIVLVGVTRRKYRPLVGDVIMIGRAPGCDIGLVSPEVAPVHCLLLRLPTGWRIRDCSGRATRVNGKAIEDEPLHNGDTIQIGAFSFETHLPASAGIPVAAVAPTQPAQAGTGDRQKLERSRRRLAERALALRARLREEGRTQEDLAARQADLDRLEARLRTSHQEQLTQLAKERQALQAQQQRLEARARELDSYARHLRQQAQAPPDRRSAAPDPGQSAELEQLRQELKERQAELDETILREREQLAAERVSLDRQRQDLERLRAELEQDHGDSTVGSAVDHDTPVEAVPDRVESARRLLRELAQRRKAGQAPAPRPGPGPAVQHRA